MNKERNGERLEKVSSHCLCVGTIFSAICLHCKALKYSEWHETTNMLLHFSILVVRNFNGKHRDDLCLLSVVWTLSYDDSKGCEMTQEVRLK